MPTTDTRISTNSTIMTQGRRLVNKSTGQGRICFISGAAQGIGAAAARAFAKEGGRVVISDLADKTKLGEAVVAELQKLGSTESFFLTLDVTKEDQWVAAYEEIEKRFGTGIDVLVNNAGVFFEEGKLEDLSLDRFKFVQGVNVEGVFLGTKHGIKNMRKNNATESKSIINLSSVAGLIGTAGYPAYHTSKGAVRLFTKSSAMYCAAEKLNIRVNSVHPGLINTPLWTDGLGGKPSVDAYGGKEGIDQTFAAATPLGRGGTAEDVASSLLYLATEESSFMTGSELVVDGGFVAQ
ncbi:NAD(P)-binding protein [Gonapodya prolifera JEL478]|uniref:NAD(P)-binding protein n=1 Tax=Gonapodya prolifera (strain JEL478) TaxID=1344416 RepID=A0A138ZXU1_GONPJ|nr:NAD(P)-binding protein [Gonapodya prolifera JEL478]|eukprot:KXS09330.1 NAD(P)-binding protein [Gonapodya prolifera JEL478]